ncbi:DNA repair RAD52-like protein 2, chloroplastic [Diospyros lotus]|uniref:DNA repair RAD52-like protein 2, chloroplastic n=1 Tax=Diospyros lotus TaxID=55363 RepID=UPI00224FDFE3|nr:DNA repair RAD52-like protein 2, chloroplastic [Diospyros lotus]
MMKQPPGSNQLLLPYASATNNTRTTGLLPSLPEPTPPPSSSEEESCSAPISSNKVLAGMVFQSGSVLFRPAVPATTNRSGAVTTCSSRKFTFRTSTQASLSSGRRGRGCKASAMRVWALDRNAGDMKAGSVPNSNYVVPLDKSSCITRPLAEILRDLNKRIPDNIIKTDDASATFFPWYHANRMLSFYAPGWCGEIRDVIFSENGSVTVVYRVTIRGSDGEAYRESTGTVSPGNNHNNLDAVAAAEEIAFCKACARFGLGLYLYHDE